MNIHKFVCGEGKYSSSFLFSLQRFKRWRNAVKPAVDSKSTDGRIHSVFWSNVFFILFVVSLIPLIVLAQYSHLMADDYGYGALVFNAWENYHSLLPVLKASCQQAYLSFHQWQGTYSAIFIMALNPGVFSAELYGIGAIILLGIFSISTAYFVRIVMKNYLFLDKYDRMIVALAVLFLSIQLMPSLLEGIYWWNGASYYLIFHSLMLVLFGFQLESIRKQNRVVRCFCASILCFIIAGGNFVTGLLTIELYTIFLLGIYKYKREKLLYLLVPYLVLLVCFAISIGAPGNAVRMSAFTDTNRYNLLWVLYQSVKQVIRYTNQWVTIWLVVSMLAIAPVLWKNISRLNYSWKYPGLIVLSSFLLQVTSYIPTVWGMGGAGGERIANIRFYLFVLLLLFNEIWLLGWLSRQMKILEEYFHINFDEYWRKRYPHFLKKYYMIVIASLIVLAPTPKNFHSFLSSHSAIISMATGEAQQHAQEERERQLLLKGDAPIIYLKKFTVKPPSLFNEGFEIGTDESDERFWINRGMARWYQKKQVLMHEQ